MEGLTPLHVVATSGCEAVTTQLIAARCNVDIQATNGYTPLHFVAFHGQEVVTK